MSASYADFEKRLPVKNKSVDVVFAGEVIEHIYHTEKFLQEARRVLSPGGRLIISTPNLAFWKYRAKLVAGIAPNILGYESGEGVTSNPGHVRYFTVRTLCDLLIKYGFVIENVDGSEMFGSIIGKQLGSELPSFARHLIITARK